MFEKTQIQEKISLEKLLELVRRRQATVHEGEETGKMYIVTNNNEIYEVIAQENKIIVNRIQEIQEKTRILTYIRVGD